MGLSQYHRMIPASRIRVGRSKYLAQRTEVEGIVFASKREANRFCVLKLEERAGLIEDLECQVSYELPIINPDTGEITIIGRYVADFRYVRDGVCVVEDSKGMRLPVYKLKKKLMKAIYGIEISEV